MAEDTKRQIAYKVSIGDLSKGRYVQQDGWDPNYLTFDDGRKISKANIFSVVVDKVNDPEMNTRILTIDDGTGKIDVRFFEQNKMFDSVSVGDAVFVVGRPREYSTILYLVPVIVKKIDHKWLEYRKKELSIEPVSTAAPAQEIGHAVSETIEEDIFEGNNSPRSRICCLIKKLDSGNGVEFTRIIEQIAEAEKILSEMQKQGDIYEIRSGYYKVLE